MKLRREGGMWLVRRPLVRYWTPRLRDALRYMRRVRRATTSELKSGR